MLQWINLTDPAMALDKLKQAIQDSAYFQDHLKEIQEIGRTDLPGLIASSSTFIYHLLSQKYPQILIITPTANKAERLKSEMEVIGNKNINIFPALDIGVNDALLPGKEFLGSRMGLLNNWLANKEQLVISSLRAIAQKNIALPVLSKFQFDLRVGAQHDLSGLVATLVEMGYERQEIVGERGEFAVKGGILDVFAINLEQPLRVEFDGDKIVSMRLFDVFSQISIQKIDQAIVLCAKHGSDSLVFEYLPKNTLVLVDEKTEIEQLLEKNDQYQGFPLLEKIKKFKFAISNNFYSPSEEPVFGHAPVYINKLGDIPSQALLISRHAQRLSEDIGRTVEPGSLRAGFVFNSHLLLTDKELFNEDPEFKKREKVVQEGVAQSLASDIKPGDYVVHEHYGIGLFIGMQTLNLGEVEQEYLVLEFSKGDKVYVPPGMVGLVEKYAGGGDYKPRLSSLGTAAWKNTKQKVKKALKDITQELIELYALREKLTGFAFPPDDIWQDELGSTFPYEETPDQQKAIAETKADMEKDRPMDRLVCGDVGYGKTEVAIRAAAKAVSAGKQVAILVPTTLLAEQHFNSFKNRFSSFPIKVEMLSRFKQKQEQRSIIQGLEQGSVDIVIATHRLLQKDIKFRDLGLLVVDEEQRFGVSQKEKIKKLKANIDILSLSATPIPRTLYLSLSGARDMSLINTAPIDRQPIRTYVLEWNDVVVREAIQREIDRGGQIYFLHNFVESIDTLARKIKKLVPEARISIAHGQMHEKILEKTMLKFMDKQIDVLICTSIIESGLDIANVNTILIDNADRFGLSQLYQIRGRVGRSPMRAYAYLFYHPGKSLTNEALERLKAIQLYTALGSGYKLAMKDLEIRGSGNLLGAQQSGHVMEIGFDLYCELLDQAVLEAKGISQATPREVQVDLKIQAFIPENYIKDPRQRIALYRRMNLIATKQSADELKVEIKDRFGKIPEMLEKLFAILYLKLAAMNAKVKSIKEEEQSILIEWFDNHKKRIKINSKDKISLALRGILG